MTQTFIPEVSEHLVAVSVGSYKCPASVITEQRSTKRYCSWVSWIPKEHLPAPTATNLAPWGSTLDIHSHKWTCQYIHPGFAIPWVCTLFVRRTGTVFSLSDCDYEWTDLIIGLELVRGGRSRSWRGQALSFQAPLGSPEKRMLLSSSKELGQEPPLPAQKSSSESWGSAFLAHSPRYPPSIFLCPTVSVGT